MRSRGSLAVGVVWSVVLVACGAPEVAVDDATESQDAIVRGHPSGPEHDAVVRLTIGRTDDVCSGTLVAPDVVLTARHCVATRATEGRPLCKVESADGRVAESTPDFAYVGDVAPSSIRVTVGPTFEQGSAPAAVGVALITPGGERMCGADIAFVVLDRAIEGIAPRTIRAEPPRVGERLTAVGWGMTETNTTTPSNVRLAREDVAVLAAGGEVLDYARKNGDVVRAGAFPGEFLAGESVCRGDSGGPLFDASGAIVGVTSRRTSSASMRCVDIPIVFTHPGAAVHAEVVATARARGAATEE